MLKSSVWKAEVRDYEIDFQGIVNNAVYFQYLDHARAVCLNEMNINIKDYAQKGINLVLVKTELAFKKPLQFNDKFYVVTNLSRVSRLKFLVEQKIYFEESQLLSLEATSLVACLNASTGKPCLIDELAAL